MIKFIKSQRRDAVCRSRESSVQGGQVIRKKGKQRGPEQPMSLISCLGLEELKLDFLVGSRLNLGASAEQETVSDESNKYPFCSPMYT